MTSDFNAINQIIEKWGSRKDFLIEILQDIQDMHSYLPREILIEISNILEIPLTQIYEISTYYKAFSLKAKGKHPIQICLGTACHVRGAPLILDKLERELRLKPGETSENKVFSLDISRCLGCCGIAPVIAVGDDVYGKITQEKVPGIIKKYGK